MYKVQIIVEATQEIVDIVTGFYNGRPFETYEEAENYAIDFVSSESGLTYEILEA